VGASATTVAGTASLTVTLVAAVPGWSAATAVTVTGPPILITGVPAVTAVSPTFGHGGTRLTVTGSGFAPPLTSFGGPSLTGAGNASGLTAAGGIDSTVSGTLSDITVTVGGVLCVNATLLSDTSVQCDAPAYSDALWGGAAEVPVLVRTAVGISPGAAAGIDVVSFTYPFELRTEWADEKLCGSSSSGGPTAALQLPGEPPLTPLPTLAIKLGTPTRCGVSISAASQDINQNSVRLTGVTELAVAPGASNVTFDSLSVAATLEPLTLSLYGWCTDAAGVLARTRTACSWRFAAPTASWTTDALAALQSSATHIPAAETSPAFAVSVAVPSGADLRGLALADRIACTASLQSASVIGLVTAPFTATAAGLATDDVFRANSSVSTTVRFPGLTLAGAPLGASLIASALCTWLPTRSVLAVPPLALRIASAAAQWAARPPPLIESQQFVLPAPTVHLADMTTPLNPSNATVSCTISAVPVAQANVSQFGRPVGAAAALDTIVIPQAVSGAWDKPLSFPAFSIAARRLSAHNVSVVCTLGTQALPPLWQLVQIAGCPPGKEPSGATGGSGNGWLCVDCPSGTFSDGSGCQACPAAGASCVGGVLQLQQAFYMPPSQLSMGIGPATQLFPCFNADACTVNATTQHYGCNSAAGYTGVLCGVCAAGFTLYGAACAACWPAWASGLLLGLLSALLLTAVIFLALWHKPGARSPAAIAFRQLTSFLQTLSMVSAFRVEAGGLLRGVLGWTDAANASLLSFGPLGCLLPLSFTPRLALTLALPLAFAAAVAAAAWLRGAVVCQLGRAPPAARTPLAGLAATPSHGGIRRSTSRSLVAGADDGDAVRSPAAAANTMAAPEISLRQRIASVLLMLVSLLYMPLVSASLRALDCYERPIDGVTYLRADLSVACGSGSQLLESALAWGTLAGLGVGFPVAIAWALCPPLLCRWRGASSAHTGTAGRGQRLTLLRGVSPLTGAAPAPDSKAARGSSTLPLWLWRPLSDGYDTARGVAWWEAAVLLRKAALAIAGTFLGGSARGVAVFACLLLGSWAAQESVRPFEEGRFNWGERLSLSGALAIALLSLLYAPSEAAQTSGVGVGSRNLAITVCIALLAAAVLLTLLVALVAALRSTVRQTAAAVRRLVSSRGAAAVARLRVRSAAFSGRRVVSGSAANSATLHPPLRRSMTAVSMPGVSTAAAALSELGGSPCSYHGDPAPTRATPLADGTVRTAAPSPHSLTGRPSLALPAAVARRTSALAAFPAMPVPAVARVREAPAPSAPALSAASAADAKAPAPQLPMQHRVAGSAPQPRVSETNLWLPSAAGIGAPPRVPSFAALPVGGLRDLTADGAGTPQRPHATAARGSVRSSVMAIGDNASISALPARRSMGKPESLGSRASTFRQTSRTAAGDAAHTLEATQDVAVANPLLAPVSQRIFDATSSIATDPLAGDATPERVRAPDTKGEDLASLRSAAPSRHARLPSDVW
jgi:hypothetical protein